MNAVCLKVGCVDVCIASWVLAACFSTPCLGFSGGTGDPNTPYLISTLEEFHSIDSDPNLWDKHFLLLNDLDLDPNFQESRVFTSSVNAVDFGGVLDGGGHAIRHLEIQADISDSVGLFSRIISQGVVRNLRLENCSIRGGNCVGTIAGISEGRLIGCSATGSVSGVDCVGGLVGSQLGTIQLCQASGTVTGTDHVGGLIGINTGEVDSCYATGHVIGDTAMGGLAGSNLQCMTACWFSGDVEGQKDVGGLVGENFGIIEFGHCLGHVLGIDNVGGLVGYLEGAVSDCYTMSDVIGDHGVGGLLGKHFSGLVSRSYAAGSVFGLIATGGLVGENYEGSVYLSYWDIQTSGLTYSAGGQGKTKSELSDLQSFKGWGSREIWILDEGKDYPRLIWEGTDGDLMITPERHYGGGVGDVNDPYLITTVDELVDIGYYSKDWDKYFLLVEDIDLSVVDPNTLVPIGYPGKPFVGVFDGGCHTLTNMALNAPTQSWQGLFGVIGCSEPDTNTPNGKVQDLYLSQVESRGQDYIGALAGLNHGKIMSCIVSIASVIGEDQVGGLIGHNEGLIEQSASQEVMIEKADIYAGGLVGSNQGNIVQSSSDSVLLGEGSYVGGLVGNNWGRIEDSYAVGSILVTGQYIGGLAGANEDGIIERTYAACEIPGFRNYVGGLCGWDTRLDTVIASFWDINISSQLFSYGGTGLTTGQMETDIFFREAGWDFIDETNNGENDVWVMPNGYPKLRWQE